MIDPSAETGAQGGDSGAPSVCTKDVWVVVPCYNEELRLDPAAFAQFLQATPEAGILFVDDGSTDQTPRVLKGIQDDRPDAVRTLVLRGNMGKAEAVRRGVLAAWDVEPRYIGFWDADLATPLSVIRDFAELLDAEDHVQLVMGARVQLLGRRIRRRRTRHYVGRVVATLISLILRAPVYDTQCGAKLFRATPSSRKAFESPFVCRWLFDVEILARLAEQAAHQDGGLAMMIYEMPLEEWRDVVGSKVRPRDALRVVDDLFKLVRRHRRR